MARVQNQGEQAGRTWEKIKFSQHTLITDLHFTHIFALFTDCFTTCNTMILYMVPFKLPWL